MVLCLAVSFSGGVLFYLDYTAANTNAVKSIARNSYGDGDRTEEMVLSIEGEDEKSTVDVSVSEQVHTRTQMEQIFEEYSDKMATLILGENESLDRVESDLDLITEIPGEEIDVSWDLSSYDVLNVYGEIDEENVTEDGTLVELVATMTYREDETMQAQCHLAAMIYPKRLYGMEEIVQKVGDDIEGADKERPQEETVALPEKIGNKVIYFYRIADKRGLVLIVMGVLFIALLYGKEVQDKEELKKKRIERLQIEYPEIVSKLTLLIGAGMPVKKAFLKIVEDYETAQKEKRVAFEAGNGKRKRKRLLKQERKAEEAYVCFPAYEEMRTAKIEMDTGVAEAEAYERFGRRCKEQAFVRLGALLSQNLKKGTKGMNDLLRMEVTQAFEERKAKAKRQGEEAGTKLLLPMFLMLIEVLVVVIVPAFLSIQL